MDIEKKIWPLEFTKILNGKKKFELRLNDFKANEGDVLVLKEFDPKKMSFTGREIRKKITYIYRFKVDELPFWPKEEVYRLGLQVLSIE